MNALDLLKADHRYVDMLFTRIEGTPPSRHMPIFKKILGEMQAHQHIEEKIFYPLLKERGDKELRDITMEAFEEHEQMKKFLQEINRSSTTKDKREAKLKVLIEDTRHHVKAEEGEMVMTGTMNNAGTMAKYFATSFAIENVVSVPLVINNCLPTSTISISLVVWLARNGLAATNSALICCWAKVGESASISCALRAVRISIRIPMARAAVSRSNDSNSAWGPSGFNRNAIEVAPGNISRSSSSRFALSVLVN